MATNGYLTSEANLGNLETELAAFRASDQRREEFVQSLFGYLKKLEAKQKSLYDELENEQEARRTWQNKARQYQSENGMLSQALNAGYFTLALIDGDGAIFHDALLAAAADGGSDAAHKLSTEIKTYLQTVDPAVSHLPLIVQIYTNLDGLSKKLFNCGIINTAHELYSFTRSFNSSQPLFSITDVGSGKERADHKLKETLRLFVNNQQCKQIVLGGISHDHGYIPNLSPMKHDLAAASRISLLETVPSEPDYGGLGFRSFRCPSVFRTEHLPNKPMANTMSPISISQRNLAGPTYPQAAAQLAYGSAVQQAVSALQASTLQHSSSAQQPRPATPPSNGTSPAPTWRTPVGRRTPSITSGVPLTPDSDPSSWATVGKSGATQKTISIAPTPKKERQFLVLNKDHERLDPPINKAKADFIALQERIKKYGKVCNYHHLQDPYCEYKHEPKITEGEKLALRIKARQKSCNAMIQCRDTTCISGHVCPYGMNCSYNSDCYFADTHEVDRNPAFRYYEDGSLEPFRPGIVC